MYIGKCVNGTHINHTVIIIHLLQHAFIRYTRVNLSALIRNGLLTTTKPKTLKCLLASQSIFCYARLLIQICVNLYPLKPYYKRFFWSISNVYPQAIKC